jgi:SAM-dependent methyltransferase
MMKCRHCLAELTLPFIDLGTAPPSNAYLSPEQLDAPETWYPLRVFACTACWLVQTQDYAHHGELFASDYAYFSSYSESWLRHSQGYVEAMTRRFELGANSLVVEVASNDGYLLQYVQAKGIPCLGIEPTADTAKAARDKGIEVREAFFGSELAQRLVGEGHAADLTAANNVLAHVPDINDFVAGFALLLKPQGVATFEFPHLMRLVAECQFDTVYHEHFSYLSLTAAANVFERNGLALFDVEEIGTHGGSLRVYAQRADRGQRERAPAVDALLERERAAGMTTRAYYEGFQARADRIKDDFVAFLIEAKRAGKRVMAYGAAAKGNTLMNYAGVRGDLISCVVDRNVAKQKKSMPGSRIRIEGEDALRRDRPDYVVILPWNLEVEVTAQLRYVNEWSGKLVVAVPTMRIVEP